MGGRPLKFPLHICPTLCVRLLIVCPKLHTRPGPTPTRVGRYWKGVKLALPGYRVESPDGTEPHSHTFNSANSNALVAVGAGSALFVSSI